MLEPTFQACSGAPKLRGRAKRSPNLLTASCIYILYSSPASRITNLAYGDDGTDETQHFCNFGHDAFWKMAVSLAQFIYLQTYFLQVFMWLLRVIMFVVLNSILAEPRLLNIFLFLEIPDIGVCIFPRVPEILETLLLLL